MNRFKYLKVKDAWESHRDVIKDTDDQYKLLEIMTGIKAETCREICNLQRAIRKVLPKGKECFKQESEAKIDLGYNTPLIAIAEKSQYGMFDYGEKPKYDFLTGEKL